MRTLTSGTILMTLLAVAGCASFDLERERVDQVKTVAIVGFTVEIESSYDEGGESYDAKSGTWHSKDKLKLTGRDLAKSHDAEKIHAELVRTLEGALGWKTVSPDRIAKSVEYADLLRFQVGRTWKPAYLAESRAFTIPGMLYFHQALEINPVNRKNILEQTGADALVFARVTLRIDKSEAFSISNLLGIGAYFPTVATEFVVADAQSENPIWHDRSAESDDDEDKGALQIGGQADYDLVMEKALVAARSSFENLASQYKVRP